MFRITIQNIIKYFKNFSTKDIDGLDCIYFFNNGDIFLEPITYFENLSIRQSTFPNCWVSSFSRQAIQLMCLIIGQFQFCQLYLK